MKIALISPKGPLYRYNGGIFKKSLRYQPLTLTNLASLIPASLNASVSVHDESIEEVDYDSLQADLVGITVITGTANRSYEIAQKLMQRGIFVVLGGPHVTLMPQEASKYANSIVTGYAEYTWPELLIDFSNKQTKKLYSMDPAFDLSNKNLPHPQRNLFNPSNFLTSHVFEATRSCVHDCEFCVAPSAFGRKSYQHDIGWVIDDIKKSKAKKLIFVDLNLISDNQYAKELFTSLIPLKIKWYGLSTVLIALDQELLELAHRSGCAGLLLGLESINPSGLKLTKKQFNNAIDFKAVIKNLHELKIGIQGCFVFGLDTDTTDVFEATAEFAIETNIDLPRFAILTPFPNTPLFTRLDQANRILTKNWELYDAQHVVFQPQNMSVEQLYQGHELAWKKVYSHKNIFKRLYGANNLNFKNYIINTGYRYYAYHLKDYYNCNWIEAKE